jgi:hypothetical protein
VYEYLDPSRAVQQAGASVLAGHTRLCGFDEIQKGPRAPDLAAIQGVNEDMLIKFTKLSLNIHEDIIQDLQPTGHLWPVVEAAFAARLMWFEVHYALGEQIPLLQHIIKMWVQVFKGKINGTSGTT